MGTRAWMLRTLLGCCAWILHGLNAAAAIPVPTEGPLGTGTAFPSTAQSQAPQTLLPATADTSTAAPLPPAAAPGTEFAAALTDGLLGGGPTRPAFPTGARLSEAVTAASEYGPHAATTASEYSLRAAAGSDAKAGPSPPEPEETQVPAGDHQALINATRSVNVSQENDAPAADAASFSTHEPLFFPTAEPNVTGAAPDTSLGTTLSSPQFVDASNNISAPMTREGAEGLQPIAGTTSVPALLSSSPLGTQPTLRATGYPATNSPLAVGITVPMSRGLDMATTGVSKEGVTLAVGFQSEASASSLSPKAEELLATQQDEQASETTHVTQQPAGETAPAAEEGPALSESGNAGDATGDAFSEPDLSLPSPGSETVSGTVGNPEETSRLASKTESSLDTSLGPDRVEQGSPGVDLDSPNSAPALTPAASEASAAPAEPDVESVSTSPDTAALPALTVPLPIGTAATDEPSLLPVPWDAAAGSLPSPVDIPDGSSPSSTSSSTADYPQLAPDAVASTLSGADDGAEVLASPNLSSPVSPSLGESEQQGTAAGASEGAELPSHDGPGTSLNPALNEPSLARLGAASPAPGGWLGTGPEQPGAVGSGDSTVEQAPGGGGSTAGDEPALSAAPASETAVGLDKDTSSPSGPGSSNGVGPESSLLETDGARPLPEAAPGSDGLSQASHDSESSPGLGAAPADSAQSDLGAAASTLLGAGDGGETPASPNLGPSQGPQETVSGSPGGAGLPLANGPGISSNPALDTSSSASLGPGGPELPGASPGLLTGKESEAVAAEQALGGGGSAAGDGSSAGFIPGSGTALGTHQLLDTASPSEPSSPIDVAAVPAISESGGAGLVPEAAPGSDGLSQASLDSESSPDLGAAPADSAQPDLGAAASTLPGPGDGGETPASPNLGPSALFLGGSEPQGTVSGSPGGAGLPLANGPGTSSNPALDTSSSASLGPGGPELPGASLGLLTGEESEAVAAEQALGGGGSTARDTSSSGFIPGSGTALGTDQLLDTVSPSEPSSPIDVAAASAISESGGAGPIPEAAPGSDGLSQASLASEGGPDLGAALGAETDGAGAGTSAGNPLSTSPDTDTSPTAFRPQQDPAVLGELSAGEVGALTDSELSPPSLQGGAEVATALGEPSLPGPVAPSSAGLDPDLGTDVGRGDFPGQSPSAFDSAQLAPDAAASALPGADDGAVIPASPNLGPETLFLGGSEPQGTVSGSPGGAGLPLANGPGTSSNPALDTSSSASLGPGGPELPGASPGLLTGEESEAVAAEQALGGGGSAAGDGSSAGFIPGSGTALGTDQLLDTASPSEPSSPIDVAAAPAISETDGAGLVPEAAPGSDGLSQASLDSESSPGLGAAPADSAQPDLGAAASTLPGAGDGGETPASPNLGPSALSLGGSEPQGTVSDSPGGAGLPLANGPGTSSNPALDTSSSTSLGPGGPELPGASLGLPTGEGSEAVAAEQALGGGGSAAGDASASSSIPGSRTALGMDQLLDTGSPSEPSSLTDVGAAPAISESGGAGPIPEAAPGSDGLSQASLDSESSPGLGAAPADSAQPDLGAAASTLLGAGDGAETPASSNLNSPVVPSLGESEPQGSVGSSSDGAGLPGTSGLSTALNPALEVPSSASFSLEGPVLPVPQGPPDAGPGLPAVQGSEEEQVLGGAGSTTGAEQSLSSALGTSKETGTNQLPDAGSLSGPALASDAAAAFSVWDTDGVSNLGGVPGAPGLSQPALGAAPGTGGAQPELHPATGEADELAKAVPGEGASPGESQGSVVEGTSVLEDLDGTGGAVEHSAPSSPSVGDTSSLGTASMTTEGTGLPDASGAASGSNTSSSGPGSSGAEGAPMSAPGIQSGSGLGASEAKLSQAHVAEMPGGETGVSADNEASLGATVGAGAGGIVQAAPGALAPLALLPPPLDAGVATAGTASLLGSSLLFPGHGLEAWPASLEGTGGSSGLVPKEKPPFPSSTHSGSSSVATGAPLSAAEVLHGPLAGAHTALPSSPDGETASGMPAPSGEEPPAALAPPNVGLAVPPAAQGLSPGSRFSSPGSTSDLEAGPSVLEKGALGVPSTGPNGSPLLVPPLHPESPGVPSGSVAAEGRGDAGSPGQPSPRLPGAAAGPGAAAQLPPRAAAEPPAQSSVVQSLAGGSSGLAPIGAAAGNPMTKFPGAGSAGGSSLVVLQPSSSSKVLTGLSNTAAGPAAAGSSVPRPVPGQGAERGGSPATARPPVSCSPTAAVPASQDSLRKVIPKPAANGAAPLLPQGSSNTFPGPLGGPATPAAPLPMTTAVPLYSYGRRENDREYVERRVDFNSPLFKPETGFPFGKSLRDSLYFTDNGQIIFPTSDKNLFPFPNPPPGGFNGHEKVPIIAVFWDDADFSRGVGTTFYQEFLTLNTAKPPFIYDVEAKIRRYMRTSYSAVWTLRITWEKAPAHTARTDTRRTNTYQAVLTTDGFRSYLLILYQDGGMRWDYSQLAAANVLIGYSSGDGSYHNDDLVRRPPDAKYRPDQFRGSNTDLRGLWIYKLESRVRTNYRLKCLAWTGQQQEPRVWSQDLPSCPCSLQQGQRDSRFRSARRGRLDSSRVTMLHSAAPNQHGAGIRCLYDNRGRFTEGRQERYWRSSRQASPYRDQELKLHDWCCNQAGSAQLCARYSEKRPEIGCDGHQASSTGRSSEEEKSHSEEQEDEDDK